MFRKLSVRRHKEAEEGEDEGASVPPLRRASSVRPEAAASGSIRRGLARANSLTTTSHSSTTDHSSTTSATTSTPASAHSRSNKRASIHNRLLQPLPQIPEVAMPPMDRPAYAQRRILTERAEQAAQRELREFRRNAGRVQQAVQQEREDRWAADWDAVAESIDMPVGEPKIHSYEHEHEYDYDYDYSYNYGAAGAAGDDDAASDTGSDVTATYWTTTRSVAPLNPRGPPRIQLETKPFNPEAFRRGSAPGATSLPAPRHDLLYRKPVDIKRVYLGPVYFDPKGKGKAAVFAYGNRAVRPGSIAAELNSISAAVESQTRIEDRIEDTLTLVRDGFKQISLASDFATQAETAKRNGRKPLPAPPAVQYSFVPSAKDIKRLLNTIGYVIIQQVFENPKATAADIISCLELEDFFAYVMSFGHQDRAAIMANNTSLRIIKNELEGLLLRDAITDGQYGEIMLKLPSEQPLGGPQAASASPARVVNGMPPPSYVQAMPGQPKLPASRATDPPKEQEIDEAVALYDYKGDVGDCNFKGGDRIAVVEYCNPEWCKGRNKRTGECGLFPFNYVRVEKQVPQYDGPAYSGPAPAANPYNAPVPPMAVANEGDKGSKGSEMGKKVGKKLGNAAIFGAGATIGSNLVNSIF